METLRVRWEIDIEADTAEDAAEQALEIMRDHHSTALVFEVTDEFGNVAVIDLMARE